MLANLRDAYIFPSFEQAPEEDELHEGFYQSTNGYEYEPSRHWCLLAEIEEAEFVIRLRLVVRDIQGHRFPVSFYLEDLDSSTGASLDLSKYRKGNTVAILYAHQHPYLDGTVGVRVEDSRLIKVLPTTMESLLHVNEEMKRKVGINGVPRCHSCDKSLDKPQYCKACGVVTYCGRECQETAWKGGHKKDCKVLRTCGDLLKFDWYHFDEFEQFPLKS